MTDLKTKAIKAFSGFALPVSALLVNVLSSRGNSKVFLRLEIYKKLLVATNLAVLIIWEIEVYLYGLIVQATLGVLLNVHFAAREICLPRGQLFKPIFVQALLATGAVISTLLIANQLGEWIDILSLLIKGTLFTLTYLAVNWWIDTFSIRALKEQLIPILKKKIVGV